MSVNRLFGILGALQRVTQPPPEPDASVAAATGRVNLTAYGQVMNLDDVVAQLANLTYLIEDVRNLLAHVLGEPPSTTQPK